MSRKSLSAGIALLVLLFGLSGCIHERRYVVTHEPSRVPPGPPGEVAQGKPPLHAPAHGLRRQQSEYVWSYYYYAQDEVYYAPDRELYFWIEGGGWAFGAAVPGRFVLDVDDAVFLELGYERPYEDHQNVKKKHKPRNRGKGRGKSRGKGRGKP